MLRLQDTAAQIRVRGAFMLSVAFVTLASLLLETTLGAFIADVILRLVDGARMMTHPRFHQKLEAVGFGIFIPVFFVTSGMRFDLAALLSSPSTILCRRTPVGAPLSLAYPDHLTPHCGSLNNRTRGDVALPMHWCEPPPTKRGNVRLRKRDKQRHLASLIF